MHLPVMPPLAPMLARATESLPVASANEMWFEPKWDGFRAVVFRDGDKLEIGSRNERPLTRYFPELVGPLRARLPQRCVLDGELVIVGPEGDLDFAALSARIHPAASRITRLATETPARFVAFDILALGDRDFTTRPFSERRRTLVDVAAGFGAPVHLTPATTDRSLAAAWFERFEGAGLDGIVAKPAAGTYECGKRAQFKIKHRHTADCVVAGYRMHRSRDGVGSLLLGLHDSRGVLHYVGAASGFTAQDRAELAGLLAKHQVDDVATHPWTVPGAEGRLPGAPNRWRSGVDAWVPLLGAPVAEVAYDAVLAGRFRHSARLLRWRPDRVPESCSYAQLIRSAPVELAEIFGAVETAK
ncbi:MAG: ATP-dependent DNA ligase [Acidimicrobiia bacterium]|nr:ATP-dependent DNA ligase [Acidimicrobiia bacterium]